MTYNTNGFIWLGFILLNIIITVSCKNCWKVSVTLIGTAICFKGSVIIFFYNTQNRIYPRQQITELTNNRPIITINNNPDFSRLYIEETQSPLHKSLFTCCICLDESEENIKTLLCGHKYHKECIEKWFTKEETCPLCRDEFNTI
tara:strand:+ start:435 stop:869 length:435 start_codon:yes stop_codon:yes gene_type:complete